MTAAYIRSLLEHGIATQAEWRQICELAIQHLEAAAPRAGEPQDTPSCADTDDPTPYRCFEEEFMTTETPPDAPSWACRVCKFTVYADQIKIVRLRWCHANALGQPAFNAGTAYCPACEDETLVEHPAVGVAK